MGETILGDDGATVSGAHPLDSQRAGPGDRLSDEPDSAGDAGPAHLGNPMPAPLPGRSGPHGAARYQAPATDGRELVTLNTLNLATNAGPANPASSVASPQSSVASPASPRPSAATATTVTTRPAETITLDSGPIAAPLPGTPRQRHPAAGAVPGSVTSPDGTDRTDVPVAALEHVPDIEVVPDLVVPHRRPRWLVTSTAVLAVAAGLWYLVWRLGTLDGTGVPGLLFLTAEVVGFASLTTTALVVTRARHRTRGPVAAPAGTLDVFITVCGEPVDMVEGTVRAALAITYPHQTFVLLDNRLAGKDGWQEIEALCLRLGVTCFTRLEGTRGKAGNLNHALARTTADFVATIDADHLAVGALAHETLGYFATDSIGFVATRQAFEIDGADILNNREPLFYDAIQPGKDRDHGAFSCGNGTVWRRSALESIGGFSEWNLVEDLHTSYELHTAGWDSVYHPAAVTSGTAPTTAAEYAHQRLRWAIDSTRLLVFDNPLRRRRRSLGGWKRFHYLHTTSSYAMLSSHAVLTIGAPLYLLFGLPLMRPGTTGDYLAHAVPYPLAIAAFFTVAIGARGAWRSIQATVFAAPLYFIAIAHTLTGRPPPHFATNKDRERTFHWYLIPQLVVMAGLIGALVVELTAPTGGSFTSLAWVVLLLLLLLGPATALTRRAGLNRALRNASRGTAVGALATVALLGALGVGPWTDLPAPADAWATGTEDGGVLTGDAVWPDSGPAHADLSSLVVPPSGAYFGAASPTLLSGPDGIDEWAAGTGVQPTIVHWFQQWHSGDTRFRGDWIDAVNAEGSVPMVTWEPWAKPVGDYDDVAQEQARLQHIIDGDHDAYIRTWAEAAAADGRPLLLRLMQEMNGDWYPWSVTHNGNTPADFVAAWRHVHDIFTETGATNVSWVWAVNEVRGMSGAQLDLASFYPGDAYVDWVSATGFNWGETTDWSEFQSAQDIFTLPYLGLLRFDKPVMISETSTVDVGGDSAEWVEEFVEALPANFPEVKALVWFDLDYDDASDFRLDPDDGEALSQGLGTTFWPGGPVTTADD